MGEKKQIELSEVAKHNSEEDCWIAVSGKVYDITKFLDDHPGGPEIITDVAGQDATDEFEDVGHSPDARSQLDEYEIGSQIGYVKKERKESGFPMWLIPLLLVLIAVAYKFLM